VWRAPGYVLRVAPDDVDLLRFERLVERVRRTRKAGDLSAAEATFREARALWPPRLADLPAIAAHQRARLDGRRLSGARRGTAGVGPPRRVG
jgi:Bacterial transcriptional activator domain